MILATQYGWGFLALLLAVPVLTWACAGITIFAAFKRKPEWAWLIPSHIPVFISVPLLFAALTRKDESLDYFTIWAFLLPGAVSAAGIVLFVAMRKPNQEPRG